MTIVYCIVWAVIATVTTWGIMTIRTSSAMARLKWAMRNEIAHWQAETSRARAQEAQIARAAATWAEAWKQGRDDTVGIMPLIISAHAGIALAHERAAVAQPAAEDPAKFR